MSAKENNYLFFNKCPVVLVAPLDWGLGHATRCIPLITYLLKIGCEVIIAADGPQKTLLQHEFSQARFVRLAGYQLSFGNNGRHTVIKLLWQIPKMLAAIKREHTWLHKFLLGNKVTAIISDNRYGVYSKAVPSVFITHQLTIKTPFGKWAEALLRRVNYYCIQKFHECWVPDFEGSSNLAGELSHPDVLPSVIIKYLGSLSRFRMQSSPVISNGLLIILSGPEPQRSIFENLLAGQLQNYQGSAILVRGLPQSESALPLNNKNVIIYNHLPAEKLNKAIIDSGIILSRPGYSTVMDLSQYNKTCIFVPTPGQAEQEYLAGYLKSKKMCLSFSQHNFSLEHALIEVRKWQPVQFSGINTGAFEKVLKEFLLSL